MSLVGSLRGHLGPVPVFDVIDTGLQYILISAYLMLINGTLTSLSGLGIEWK